ncbi:hypothetical protein EMCRGX_G012023 [Ephydatia muelleri]|eukprot:Em0006g482a
MQFALSPAVILLACTMTEAVNSHIFFDRIQPSWVEGSRISIAANINFSYYGSDADRILTCYIDPFSTFDTHSWPAEWNVTATSCSPIGAIVLSMTINITAAKSLNGRSLLCNTTSCPSVPTKQCSAAFIFNITSDTSNSPSSFQNQSTSVTAEPPPDTASSGLGHITNQTPNGVQFLNSSKCSGITTPQLWIFAITTLYIMTFAVF